MSGRILIAEDDEVLGDFIALGLQERGYLSVRVGSVSDLVDEAVGGAYALWVIDRRLKGGDSLPALKALRKGGVSTPALVLTAMSSVEHRIAGFDAGADDYLAKPFAIAELFVRVRALLRRPPGLEPPVVDAGKIQMLLDERRLLARGQEIQVTANEWRLLRLLSGRPDVPFSRSQIMTEVGISDDAGEVAVDHLVSRLRSKLREYGADRLIRTVRGIGFAWDAGC